jgi:hypothetical protein
MGPAPRDRPPLLPGHGRYDLGLPLCRDLEFEPADPRIFMHARDFGTRSPPELRGSCQRALKRTLRLAVPSEALFTISCWRACGRGLRNGERSLTRLLRGR